MDTSRITVKEWTGNRTENELFKFIFKDKRYDCCLLDGVYHIKRAGQITVFTRFTGNEYVAAIDDVIDYKETYSAKNAEEKETIRNLCYAIEQLKCITAVTISRNMFDHVREPLVTMLRQAEQNLDEVFAREGFRQSAEHP